MRKLKSASNLCKIDDCTSSAESWGMCGKHYMRTKRYGDANYVTPEEIRRANNRTAQIASSNPKKSTYKKLHGKHEHRVIAEQKIGRALLSNEHVHHIDGDKHNNHPNNLEVLLHSEHARLHAKDVACGEKSHRAKLTEIQVVEIRNSSLSTAKLGKIYGISQSAAWRVKTNQTYKS